MLGSHLSHPIIITSFFTIVAFIPQKFGTSSEEPAPWTITLKYATPFEFRWTATSMRPTLPDTTSTTNATKLRTKVNSTTRRTYLTSTPGVRMMWASSPSSTTRSSRKIGTLMFRKNGHLAMPELLNSIRTAKMLRTYYPISSKTTSEL